MTSTFRFVAFLILVPAIAFSACSSKSNSSNKTATAGADQGITSAGTSTGGAAAAGQPGQTTTPRGTPVAGASPQSEASIGAPDTNTTSGTPAYSFSSPEAAAPFTPAPPPPATPGAATAAAPTAPTSPAITIGAASVVSGAVNVPIGIVGSGLAPYTAFSVHLRWDPRVFKFSSTNSNGTVLPGSVFCPPVQIDADGNGAALGCLALGGAATTSGGLLATFILTPVGTGCSALHLYTYQGADGGDDSTGTLTLDADAKPLLSATIDGRIDQTGQTC